MSQDIGVIIEQLVHAREQLKAAQNEVKRCEEALEAKKRQYMDALGQVGLKEGRNGTHSAAIVEKVVPQVTDWDAFYDFIHSNKFYHLLQRRPSTTGCQELFATQGSIPGVVEFRKVDISIRSL